jgi:co-chaperonin GroES (HSP10)|tara:strand:- start:50 stop:313 length:264 start_codon:yes stop_codon:yes gene_type:complete
MEMKMKNDYLLIQEIEQQETKTESGLIIPIEKHNRQAKIINAGNTEYLKDGDVILKNMGKGTMLTLNDIEFEVIHINQIIAIIEDNG